MSPRRRYRSAAREREHRKQAARLRATRITRRIRREAVAAQELDTFRDFDPDERRIINRYIAEAKTGTVSITWNGPLAQYLDLIGRRAIRENIDVGMTP